MFPHADVDSIRPRLIGRTRIPRIQIAGTNFRSGAVASSPLAVQSTTFNSSTHLSAVVNSTGATEGIKPLTVTNHGHESATLQEAMLGAFEPRRVPFARPGPCARHSIGAPVGPNGTRDVQVAGVGGVPANGVRAVLMNVTVAGPTGPSYLTIFPTGHSPAE